MNLAALDCIPGKQAHLGLEAVLGNRQMLVEVVVLADASGLSTGFRPSNEDPEGLVGLDTSQLAVMTCLLLEG